MTTDERMQRIENLMDRVNTILMTVQEYAEALAAGTDILGNIPISPPVAPAGSTEACDDGGPRGPRCPQCGVVGEWWWDGHTGLPFACRSCGGQSIPSF